MPALAHQITNITLLAVDSRHLTLLDARKQLSDKPMDLWEHDYEVAMDNYLHSGRISYA
jgi:hypothetical protein